jgi:hypothetical protein
MLGAAPLLFTSKTMAPRKRSIHSRRRQAILSTLLVAGWLCPSSRAWWMQSTVLERHYTRCSLSRQNKEPNPEHSTHHSIESLLIDHGFHQRIIQLTPENLPILAEFQQGGKAQVCCIQEMKISANAKNPKLGLELPDGSSQTVDLGQITNIWQEEEEDCRQQFQLLKTVGDISSIEEASWPVGHVESVLDQLWKRRGRTPGGGGGGGGGLAKKQIAKLVAACPESNQADVDQVLRQVVKAGRGYSQLVDSGDVRWALFQGQPKAATRELTMLQRRAYAANVLSEDAREGGRFKRFGCIALPRDNEDDDSSSSSSSSSISVINGGWLVLDQSLRAASEARKFSERAEDDGSATLADERIIYRLERLALEGPSGGALDEKTLELDVREALKTMGLPVTSLGAKDALIRIGRWSESKSKRTVEAWSPSVLAAAEWYSNMDQQRRSRLYNAADEGLNKELEGRVDLTSLPCICVDAVRTSFRDDAMSVRPRASTGRKMDPKASKWEILLHISDVSDIYVTNPDINDPDGHLQLLGKAAAGRGVSRYNLPTGPLHLLPPMVLQTLALETNNPDLTSNSHLQMERKSINRCVTLWAYIDERSGKILDAGVERTIISCPLALSFDSATKLLDGSMENTDPALQKARAVLGIVERNVGRWKEYHTSHNEASQAREKRLAARELVGRHVAYGDKRRRDDGREGFVRTRGHHTVDACLELYGHAVNGFLRKTKAALPRVAGTGPDRLGRVATAPLRRFVDGIAQQQALAVLCGYGGKPLSKQECVEIGKEATRVINAINNLDTRKPGSKRETSPPGQQRKAIKALKLHLASGKTLVPAIGTGRQNEVVILGVGTVASCKGVRGTLKPGEKVMVKVTKVDEENGKVSAVLV